MHRSGLHSHEQRNQLVGNCGHLPGSVSGTGCGDYRGCISCASLAAEPSVGGLNKRRERGRLIVCTQREKQSQEFQLLAQNLLDLSIVANKVVFLVQRPIEFQRVRIVLLSSQGVIPSEPSQTKRPMRTREEARLALSAYGQTKPAPNDLTVASHV